MKKKEQIALLRSALELVVDEVPIHRRDRCGHSEECRFCHREVVKGRPLLHVTGCLMNDVNYALEASRHDGTD